nr:PD-(D/E)XK nuclease family protein [uncultured Fusobacterium sp.]
MGENIEFDNKKLKELIDKSKDLMKDYLSRDSSEINILNAINQDTIEHNHSKILNVLFSKIHTKNGRDSFLTLFLKKIGIENIDEDEFSVEREYRCDPYGQMDFKIENENLCIVLEMKIYAEDGFNQLRRYEKYCLKNKKDYRIFYLTLNGHKPSAQSIEGFENKNNLKCISFKEDILPCLEECLELVRDEKIKNSFILQYISTIKNLIEKEKYRMAGLIEKTEDARAIAFLYEKVLKDKMQEILENFLYGIGERIVKDKKVLEYIHFDNSIEDYYIEKCSGVPSISFLLEKFEKDEKIYYFNFEIEVNKDGLIGCLGFYEYYEKNDENNYDWIKYEEMKNIDSHFFEKWDKKIRELNRKDLKTYNAKWFYLLDSQRKKIFFNDISPSSSTLDLIHNVDREVDYLSKYIIENIIEKLF